MCWLIEQIKSTIVSVILLIIGICNWWLDILSLPQLSVQYKIWIQQKEEREGDPLLASSDDCGAAMGPREGVTDGVGVTDDDRDELNGKHQTSSEWVSPTPVRRILYQNIVDNLRSKQIFCEFLMFHVWMTVEHQTGSSSNLESWWLDWIAGAWSD